MDSTTASAVARSDRVTRSAAKSKRSRSKSPAPSKQKKNVQVTEPLVQSTPVSSKKSRSVYKRKGTPAPSSAQRALADLEEEEEEEEDVQKEDIVNEEEEEAKKQQQKSSPRKSPRSPKASSASKREQQQEEAVVTEGVVVIEKVSFYDEEEDADTNSATTFAIRISYSVAFILALVAYFQPTLLLHDLKLDESTRSATKYISLLYFHTGFILAAVAQSNHEAKKKVLQYTMASYILFAAAPVAILYNQPFTEDQIKSMFAHIIFWLLLLGLNLHACYYVAKKEQ